MYGDSPARRVPANGHETDASLVIQQCLNAPEDGADDDGEDDDGSGEDDKHDGGHQGQPGQGPSPYDPRGPMPGPPYQPPGPPQQQQHPNQPRGMPPQMIGGPMPGPGQYGQPYHPQMMGNEQYSDQGYMHQQ